jgi:hypothetical protein
LDAIPVPDRILIAMQRCRVMSGLVCSGLRVSNLLVPPFRVGPGEIVKLVFSKEQASAMDEVSIALSRQSSDAVCAAGAVVVLESPMTQPRLREVFHRQTAADWLVARTGMTRGEASAQLQGLQLDPNAPLSVLAGTPRWLIGFLAASHQHPSALIFSTAGLDPNGIHKALSTANEQLQGTAGIYLTCFPNVPVQQPPYAAVLEVRACEPQLVESATERVGGL